MAITDGLASKAPPSIQSEFTRPVWRFGRVLRVAAGEPLRSAEAIEVGPLFSGTKTSRKLAGRLYFERRMTALETIADNLGGQIIREPTSSQLGHRFKKLLRSQQRDETIKVYYHYVPVVSFPQYVLELASARWIFSEVITVCGKPAKSKVWIKAILAERNGELTTEKPVGLDDLNEARRSIEAYRCAALDSLVEYYEDVFREIATNQEISKELGWRPRVEKLVSYREVEIFGVTGSEELESQFRGLLDDQVDGYSHPEVGQFKRWALTSDKGISSNGWTEGSLKMVSLLDEKHNFDALRALVIPMRNDDTELVWYGSLAESLGDKNKPSDYPSDRVTRLLSQEYGSAF